MRTQSQQVETSLLRNTVIREGRKEGDILKRNHGWQAQRFCFFKVEGVEWGPGLVWYRLREERERNVASEGAMPVCTLRIVVGALNCSAVPKPAVTSKSVG